MTRTTPLRLTSLQFSQILLTLAFTFIVPFLLGAVSSGRARSPSAHHAQNLRAVLGQRHRMLEVSGQRPILGHDRPLVGHGLHFPAPHGDHGLDGADQTRPELGAVSRLAEVGHLRILVQLLSDPVSDQGPHYPVAEALGMGLDGIPHVPQPVVRLEGVDSPSSGTPGSPWSSCRTLRGHSRPPER